MASNLHESWHMPQRSHLSGSISALLDTFSFQARPFYERFGYQVIAELPDCPRPGIARYYMRKALGAPASED